VTALSALLRKTPGEGLREYFDRPEIDLPVEIDWTVRDLHHLDGRDPVS
jgi:hypothetical protein